MKLITTLAVVCLSASALAQGVRYDHRVATIATNYPPGAQVPVMAIPNAQVTLCVDGNCGTKAAIFSNQALTVPTSNPMQADGQGNFGFWAAAGTYFYKVVEPSGKVNGIYPITLGGSGDSSGPVVQVNGTPLITQSPVNFQDAGGVTFTNPSAGIIHAAAAGGGSGCTLGGIPTNAVLSTDGTNCKGDSFFTYNFGAVDINNGAYLLIEKGSTAEVDGVNDPAHNNWFLTGDHLFAKSTGANGVEGGIDLNINDGAYTGGGSGPIPFFAVYGEDRDGGASIGMELTAQVGNVAAAGVTGVEFDAPLMSGGQSAGKVYGFLAGMGTTTNVTTEQLGFLAETALGGTINANYCDFMGRIRTGASRESIGCGPTFTNTFAGPTTFQKPVTVNDGTGQGGTADLTEGTTATAAAGHDILYADAISHCMKYSANGGVFACLGSGGGGGTIPATSLVLKGSGTAGTSVAASPATDYQLPEGVWQHEGTIIAPTLAEQYLAAEPSLIYEGSPHLLSGTIGNIFKMWWTCGLTTTGLCYAESVDGEVWQRAASPVIAATNPGPAHGYVFHYGSTYYYYAANSVGAGTAFDRYESSDGITWTKTHPNVLVLGGSGAWDSAGLGNMYVIPSSGTWLMMYEAQSALITAFSMGVASSADQGVTWTKFSGNPTIQLTGGADEAGGPEIHVVNGVYYVWGQCSTGGSGFPNDICRWHSPTFLSNSWVIDNGGNPVFTRASVDEGAGNPVGQVADPSMVEVNGSVYMAYEGVFAQNGTTPGAFHMKLATAPLTFAKLAQTNEGNATNLHSGGGFNSLNLFGVQGGGNQCLHADNSGNVTGAGSDCGGNITPSLTVSGCVITGTQCVVTTPGATITFSAIPAGYSSIEVIGNYNNNGVPDSILARFNGDSGSHYVWNQVFALGTSVSAQSSGGLAGNVVFGATPGNATSAAFSGSFDVLLPNYSNTTFNKTVIGQGTRMDSSSGNASVLQNDDGHWLSTAAITSITIFPSVTNFLVGSSFSIIAKP